MYEEAFRVGHPYVQLHGTAVWMRHLALKNINTLPVLVTTLHLLLPSQPHLHHLSILFPLHLLLVFSYAPHPCLHTFLPSLLLVCAGKSIHPSILDPLIPDFGVTGVTGVYPSCIC